MKHTVLLLLLLVSSCKSSDEQAHVEPIVTPVYAENPQVSDVPIYIEALGTLQPMACVDVRPRVGGIVSHVHVCEGQWVEEGMSLFQIDSQPHVIKLQQAKAQLAGTKARLAAAKKKHDRFKALSDKNLISQNEWDQIETELLQAKAQVQLDFSCVKEAALTLQYCTICAHKSGRVGKVDIHPGHLVSQTQEMPLAQIVCMDPIIVEFAVTEAEFSKLSDELLSSKLPSVELYLLSAPQKLYKGQLTFTDNHFDAATGQILVRAKVANETYELRPGMSVKVRIAVDVIKEAYLVPQKAIKHNQFGAFVYVVEADNTVTLRQVKVGAEHKNAIIVLSGIEVEDLIITAGHERASVGAKVDVK